MLERDGDVLQRRHGVEPELNPPRAPVLLEHLRLDKSLGREGVAPDGLEERLRLLAGQLEEGAEVAQVRGGERGADEGDEDEVEVRLGVLVEDSHRRVRVAELHGRGKRVGVDTLGVGAKDCEVCHDRGHPFCQAAHAMRGDDEVFASK